MNIWDERVRVAQQCAARFVGKPLDFKQYDCVRQARYVMHLRKQSTGLLKGVKWGSEAGAYRAMRKLGFASLIEGVDATGLLAIPFSMVRPADLVAMPGDDAFGCSIGVYLGDGYVSGYQDGADVGVARPRVCPPEGLDGLMAKAVKAVGTAIMIVGAVVATGGMALAMGAGVGLLGSASLATSAVLSVGSFSVSAGALLSVGSLVSSIGGSLAQPKVSSAGGALGWVGDPNGPLHFAAGRIAVGGDLRHKAAYGPNDRMYFSAVTVVSDAGPIEAFESFTANDIAVTFDASGKANTSYYANVMWRRTQLGFQPEGSYLASPSGLQGGASLPNWGASHKLSGKAAFILTLSENSKQSAYKGQYPKPRTIIRGLRVYDWRRDSTYPGGAGPQRLNDPSAWAYSANPILWSVKWLLGLWEGPTGKGAPQVDYQVGGIGTRWENIDIAAFTEAANIADTHGWTCAAWPSTDDDKAQVLDAFLQAGGAYYIERAGKASCIHRAAPRVSVATITAADTAGPIELDTSASYLDRKNTGVATYLSEADGWKMTALPEVSSSQWVTEDGGRKRSVPVTYSYVDKAKQAAELICLGLAHTREGISGRIPLKSYMQGIGPGSAFTITEPEFVLDGLKCLCLETSYDANTGVHTVTFVSETDAKYPFAFGQTPNPPPPPALTPVDPTHVSPPLPGDWTITPRTPAPGGGQLPGFDLGGIVSNETATAVIVEHGPTATGPWKQAYQGPTTVTTIPIDGLQPGATYYIAVQYQRDQNYSERYVYGPYTAPLLDPSPTAPTIVSIRNDIEAAFGDIFDVSELLADARTQLDAQGAEIAAARGGQSNLSARIAQVNQARIDGDQANATAISGVAARTTNTEADIIDLENALANETTARAQAITQLQASAAGSLNQNPHFSAWAGSLPDGWTNPNSANTAFSKVAGINGQPNSLRAQANANISDFGFVIGGASSGGEWIVAELDFTLVSGGLNGTGLTFSLLPVSGPNIANLGFPFRTTKDASGVVHGDGEAGKLYRYRLLIDGRRAGVASYNGRVRNYLSTFGTPGALPIIDWHKVLFRPATPEEIAAGTALPALQASVTDNTLAIVDLENQQVLAAWQKVADASGGKPARIGLVSSTLGSYVALDAPYIFWGDNTVFDDATDTLQTTVGGRIRVLALGAPFGNPANLVEWWGPTGIALSAMTTTNGYNGRMQVAPYVFENAFAPKVFSAYASPASITAHRATAGSLTTAVVSILYQNAKGAVTVSWERFFGGSNGFGTAVVDSPNQLSTTFTKTVGGSERTETLFVATVTDTGTGERRQVTVPVVFTSGSV